MSNVLYRNTLIDNTSCTEESRTWISHDYPQSIIDNYLPSEDNYFYDIYKKDIYENVEYHYFGIEDSYLVILVIRKYQN